jgi:hypothetical protein
MVTTRHPPVGGFEPLLARLQQAWQAMGVGQAREAYHWQDRTLILGLQGPDGRALPLPELLSPAFWEAVRQALSPGQTALPWENRELALLPALTLDLRPEQQIRIIDGHRRQEEVPWWRHLVPPDLQVPPSLEARALFEAGRWHGLRRLNVIGAMPPLATPPPGLLYLTDDPDGGSGLTFGEAGGWLTSPATVPPYLRQFDHWVVWGAGYQEKADKPTKIPVQPEVFEWDAAQRQWHPATAGRHPAVVRMFCAKANAPETWGGFHTAVAFLARHPEAVLRRPTGEIRHGRPVYGPVHLPLRGLQFALHPQVQLLGIDIDHCIEDGKLSPEAADILHALPGYWEYSPSLTGLRGFFIRPAELEVPSSREFERIEIYDGRSWRFLTVTGQHLGVPDVGPLDMQAWNWVLRQCRTRFARPGRVSVGHYRESEVVSLEKPDRSPSNQRGLLVYRHASPAERTRLASVVISSRRDPYPDEVLLEMIRHSPHYGARFEFYYHRWDMVPDELLPPEITPDPTWVRHDHSRGDSQLVSILSAFTQDPEQIDRIFRRSPRMRPKWDRYISHGGETYAEYTIGYALGLRGIELPFGFLGESRRNAPASRLETAGNVGIPPGASVGNLASGL